MKYSWKFGKDNPLFYGTMDLSSAFRILPTKPKQCFLTVLKAEDSIKKKIYCFVDKNLAMGSSISCSHFQRFSNCLRHVTEYLAGVNAQIVNYLDDFLYIDISEVKCQFIMDTFKQVCTEIGVPIAQEKTRFLSNRIIFQGILMCGNLRILSLLIEKKDKAIKQLMFMLDRKKVTVKQIEKLTGTLNFLTKVIFLGRAFTRRMYAKISMSENKGYKLKSYHHVLLDREFKKDCKVWLEFLKMENQKVICRPYVDLSETIDAEKLNFFSDASTEEKMGFGCLFQDEFAFSQWEPGYISGFKPCIEYLEFYALCIGLFI